MVILTREQLEDRLVALHRASLELVRELNLDTLLKRIVELAREQVDARYAALGVVDEGGNLVKFIPVGMTSDEISKTGSPPVGRGAIGAIQKERRTLRIADLGIDPTSEGFPPGHPIMESFLGVPILLGDQLLGQIYLTDKIGYPEFTESDERVIETLAAYAAVALHNARMYENLLTRDKALSQSNKDQSLVNDIATSLASSLDVDEILEQTLTRVMDYLSVQAGEIFLREDGDRQLRLALSRGELTESFLTRDCFKIGEGFIGIVAESGAPLVSTDLGKDMRFLRPEVVKAGFRSMACIPLVARGAVIGVMSVASRMKREFDEREIAMLTAIGVWAGITIENARLHRQARRLAVMEERELIGMDLHDGIIQSIYAVGLALERPRQFVGDSLSDGLQRLVDEYRANTLADASLVAPEDEIASLPSSHATALFHICQEALANVAKHSQARRTQVQLWSTKERVLLEVADNGRGFDLRKMSITLGHGLSNMHVRARKVGGDVEITSAPEEGTTVLAWVPRRAQ